jgi:hypothetical protein
VRERERERERETERGRQCKAAKKPEIVRLDEIKSNLAPAP